MAEDRVAVIAALIIERPLYGRCISTKASISAGEVPAYVARIGTVFVVRDAIDRCRAWGNVTTVFSLTRR